MVITRSQAEKRKGPQEEKEEVSIENPKKKTRLSPNEEACPKAKELLKRLRLSSDFFKSGKAEAHALDPDDPAFENITTYVNCSASDNSWLKGMTIYKIRTNPKNSPEEHSDDPKNEGKLRKMLWHGTSATNVQKILEEGLKVPNKTSDPFFGAGIYFSDSFMYSLDYTGFCDCASCLKNNEGKRVVCVFLSDVLLGEVHKSYELIPHAPKCKKVKKAGGQGWEMMDGESVQGCARETPDPQGDQTIDGCVWPLGKPIFDEKAPFNEDHIPENEYVIYEARRAIPKYLVTITY